MARPLVGGTRVELDAAHGCTSSRSRPWTERPPLLFDGSVDRSTGRVYPNQIRGNRSRPEDLR
jgi:hypothetical protein